MHRGGKAGSFGRSARHGSSRLARSSNVGRGSNKLTSRVSNTSRTAGFSNQSKISGLANGPGNRSTGQLANGSNRIGNGLSRGPGNQTPNGFKTASAANSQTGNPAAGKRFYDQMGATKNTSPTSQNPQIGPTNNTSPTSQTPKAPNPSSKWTLVGKGQLPWVVRQGIDAGITYVVPVYGPVKAIYDAGATLGPGIKQTLKNSEDSQKKREEDKAAEIEAGKARQDQGGGFLGGGLKKIDMDP
jgi:hypothetical protein